MDTMLRLGCDRAAVRVVADQHCTPSNVSDVADGILTLIALRAGGTYHVVNEGDTTWHEFATEVSAPRGLTCKLRQLALLNTLRPRQGPHTASFLWPNSIPNRTKIARVVHRAS